jgi:hypothetical protein
MMGKARQTALERLDESKIVESEELFPSVVLDYNAENQEMGVEILHLSWRAGPPGVGQAGLHARRGGKSTIDATGMMPLTA